MSVLWKPWCSPSLCHNLPRSLWSLLSNHAIMSPLRTLTFKDFLQDSISGICLTSWEHKGICWWQGEDIGVIFSDNVYSTSVICVLQGSWELNHMCCICINGNLRRRGHSTIKMFSFPSPITQTHANNYSQTLYHGVAGCSVERTHCFNTWDLKTNSALSACDSLPGF